MPVVTVLYRYVRDQDTVIAHLICLRVHYSVCHAPIPSMMTSPFRRMLVANVAPYLLLVMCRQQMIGDAALTCSYSRFGAGQPGVLVRYRYQSKSLFCTGTDAIGSSPYMLRLDPLLPHSLRSHYQTAMKPNYLTPHATPLRRMPPISCSLMCAGVPTHHVTSGRGPHTALRATASARRRMPWMASSWSQQAAAPAQASSSS